MILVMLAQTYKTIRSIFSKASDLPITIERLNSTTYVYATVKKYSAKGPSIWMFNFLYFTGKLIYISIQNKFYCLLDPERSVVTSRYPGRKNKYLFMSSRAFNIVLHKYLLYSSLAFLFIYSY
jgi:hypothetical protein